MMLQLENSTRDPCDELQSTHRHIKNIVYKIVFRARFMSLILAAWKAEIRRIVVQGQPGKIV
jgi:hypothetical protein